jgi:hypothetical protein
MTEPIPILRINRPDRFSRVHVSSKEPNRIPWNIYYIVPTVNEEELAKLFRTAWVVHPNTSTTSVITTEWAYSGHYPPATYIREELRNLLYRNKACLVIPTYVNRDQYYAYQYARKATKAKATNLGTGLGKFYFLHEGKFEPACLYCPRSVYFLTGVCTPGTNSCISTYWRKNGAIV